MDSKTKRGDEDSQQNAVLFPVAEGFSLVG